MCTCLCACPCPHAHMPMRMSTLSVQMYAFVHAEKQHMTSARPCGNHQLRQVGSIPSRRRARKEISAKQQHTSRLCTQPRIHFQKLLALEISKRAWIAHVNEVLVCSLGLCGVPCLPSVQYRLLYGPFPVNSASGWKSTGHYLFAGWRFVGHMTPGLGPAHPGQPRARS